MQHQQSAIHRAMRRWFRAGPQSMLTSADKVRRRAEKAAKTHHAYMMFRETISVRGWGDYATAQYDVMHYMAMAHYWLAGGDAETAWRYSRAASRIRASIKVAHQ